MPRCACPHAITLALEDSLFFPISSVQPFEAVLEVRVHRRHVSIDVPALSFTLPVPGFVYTSARNLLRQLWPIRPLPPSAPVLTTTGVALVAYIFADGTLRLKGPDGAPIPAGSYRTQPVRISYRARSHCDPAPPLNFAVSTQGSNIIGTPENAIGIDYADFLVNDFVANRVAFLWLQTQNGGVPRDQQYVQIMCRTGRIDSHQVLHLNEPVVVYVPPNFDPQTVYPEPWVSQVAIDPANPNRVVIASNIFFSAAFTIAIFTSDDFGRTWSAPQYIPPLPAPPPGSLATQEEPFLLFDSFGNLFLSFEYAAVVPPTFVGVVSNWQLWNSVDAGRTFRHVFTINALDPRTTTPETPAIAIGPDGQGGTALWYTWTLTNLVGAYVAVTYAGYMPVLGKDRFGAHVEFEQTTVASPRFSNGLLRVGNAGQVYLYIPQYLPDQDNSSPGFDNPVYLFVNPTGTRNFSSTSFVSRGPIFTSNLSLLSPISWQPARGIFGYAINGILYDRRRGRLYAFGNDERPRFTIDDYVAVFYVYSDDDGVTWSDMHTINDVPYGSRGLATFALDPCSGHIAGSFYDTRRYEPDRTTVDYFGAVFDPCTGRSAVREVLPAGCPSRGRGC